MAHIRCDFRSEVLDMGTSMTVFLPESIKTSEARVLYLLHGLADNCTGWSRYTIVERLARMNNVVVVIPEVQRSYYTDMAMGLPYFKFVHTELPQICKRMFNITDKPEKTYIMGLSMGGYGTLKSMLTSPSRYAGCATFSAVPDICEVVANEKGMRHNEYKAIFGPRLIVKKKDNPIALLADNKKPLPKIYMACGEQDSFMKQNEDFVAALKEKGADVLWEHWEGDHNWVFWDEAIKRAFKYFFEEK